METGDHLLVRDTTNTIESIRTRRGRRMKTTVRIGRLGDVRCVKTRKVLASESAIEASKLFLTVVSLYQEPKA